MAYFVDTRLGSTVAIVNGNGQRGVAANLCRYRLVPRPAVYFVSVFVSAPRETDK